MPETEPTNEMLAFQMAQRSLEMAVRTTAIVEAHVIDCTSHRQNATKTMDRLHDRVDEMLEMMQKHREDDEVRRREDDERRERRDQDFRGIRQWQIGIILSIALVFITLMINHFWK